MAETDVDRTDESLRYSRDPYAVRAFPTAGKLPSSRALRQYTLPSASRPKRRRLLTELHRRQRRRGPEARIRAHAIRTAADRLAAWTSVPPCSAAFYEVRIDLADGIAVLFFQVASVGDRRRLHQEKPENTRQGFEHSSSKPTRASSSRNLQEDDNRPTVDKAPTTSAPPWTASFARTAISQGA